MSLKITLEIEKCCASGACALACPEIFGQDATGIVYLADEHPADSLYDEAVDAADACPAAVIEVERGPAP